MSESVLKVGKTTETEYDSIQSAIVDAEEGDTVEVHSGVYKEQIDLDKSILLSARGEVTLDGENIGEETNGSVFGTSVGSGTRGIKIEPGTDIAPEIVGFDIKGYEVAIDGDKTVGPWSVRDVTLTLNGDDGISAVGSEGDWKVSDSVIALNLEEGIDAGRTSGSWSVTNTIIERNGDDGIEADSRGTTSDWRVADCEIRHNGHHGLELKESTGDWTVSRTKITDNEFGVGAQRTTGDWAIESSELGDNRFVGVSCVRSKGDWKIDESRITNVSTAVWAPATSGDWKIANSIIGETYLVPNDNVGKGTAIVAPETRGRWVVENCLIKDVEKYAINASGADPRGIATGNRWGHQTESAEIVSVGNVTCENPLSEKDTPQLDHSVAGSSIEFETLDYLASNAERPEEFSILEVSHLLVDQVDVFE